jgi:metallophosphoesterase superfamily enzyme
VRTRGGGITRPCFLIDARRIILPSFGTYTGGLRTRDPALAGLMDEQAVAVLTGQAAVAVPMPR